MLTTVVVMLKIVNDNNSFYELRLSQASKAANPCCAFGNQIFPLSFTRSLRFRDMISGQLSIAITGQVCYNATIHVVLDLDHARHM